jgi:hypothetical protein
MLQVYRARTLLILAILVCFGIFWCAGALVGFPSWRVPGASLLDQPSLWRGIGELVAAGIAIVVCVVIASFIGGRVRADAGLFAASAGLAALSIRGGTLGDLLRGGATPGTYLLLLLEAIVLFAILAGAWRVQCRLHHMAGFPPDSAHDGFDEPDEPIEQKLTATVATALGMIVALSILAQTDDKAQVLCAVALAGLIGATIAHTLFPVRPSIWFWTGPLLVAALGYIVAYLWPQGWQIGVVQGQFAALARPLPLDYASAGPAGALLGYWLSRQWHASRNGEEQQEQPA